MRQNRFPQDIRHDGWTIARQLDFLDMLARTRSATRAARAVGMSRESAYRLRSRQPDGLFAAAWERTMRAGLPAPSRADVDEGHMRAIRLACRTESADPRRVPRRASIS